MSANPQTNISVADFSEQAYLNYSMYVILDRALPFIGDGLKPVQRRIVYAMSDLGLHNQAKHKKSARTVGDVLGKFHPHGDNACYEAMVLMAQDFSYRYPLIDGQGNWGAPDDPKSFAAMRYTEARLSAYSAILLNEVTLGTVDWIPNFDGSLEEPKYLPAQLPNVLLNGGSGIAVGMATDIPSHNLTEVINACVHLLAHPNADLETVMTYIPAPDYPCDAQIVTDQAELSKIYQTGIGSLKMRAVYHKEQGQIIIDALPYQVSGSKIIAQIAQLIQAKKLALVDDLKDESDHKHPTRIVIVPRSQRVDVDQLMLHLYATTDLEKNYRVNMNVIGLNGKPQVKNLVDILSEWLTYRRQIVVKRLTARLDKINERLHILAGLLIAFLHIDEIIYIIRHEDEPKAALIARYQLTEEQTEAILQIRLRQLAKLEEIKIQNEQQQLEKEQKEISTVLGSTRRLNTFIKKELLALAKKYGDKRRCQIVNDIQPAKVLDEHAMTPVENITVILSDMGWVRTAKGHDIDPSTLNYKSGDSYLRASSGRSNQPVMFLDSTGRVYTLSAHTLPSARGFGEPLTGKLSPQPGAKFVDVLIAPLDQHILLASQMGYGFVVGVDQLQSNRQSGKAMININDKFEAIPMALITAIAEQWVVVASNVGRLLVFPVQDLPILTKGKGNKLINIPRAELQQKKEFVQSIAVLSPNDALVVFAGKRHVTIKFDALMNYVGKRTGRGQWLPRGYRNVVNIQAVARG